MGSALAYFLPFTGYPYRGDTVDCPVCGSARHAPIARHDRKAKRLTTELCHDCGMFFTNPMPSEAELAAYYASVYRLEYQLARLRPRRAHSARKAGEAARRRAALGRVMDLDRPRRILEFGCGSGELAVHLAEGGHAVTGFDPHGGYTRHARERAAAHASCTIRTGRWQEMTFAPASFEAITCLHVLEHLATPVPALARMRDWLAPGGILYLEVPDMQAYEPKGPTRFHFAHVLGFCSDTLGLAARRAGFGLVSAAAPTSLFLADAADRRAAPFALDPRRLAATAARNAADYGTRPPLARRLAYHLRRIRRLLAREFGG
ncbi:hypothetical protein LNKW23_19010 [Paralimibaculum aggregatum]|uniref:Class I SAM-dependent methyltransferase n=1 Tax=Paralimibaculum aggregatum TaxID=3036245 RepID=A0ABQ6LPB4_9RHOB|nr:class I SAM-dependent methyltransferase [Limibaculum sp. NKW23]GMG82688.1 hypothetical protein LNKW23_19010 [Limibaculum sp. NKW23]